MRTKPEKKMDRAALYLRLSKEDGDKADRSDDSESIVNQRLLLTDYALRHEMQIVDVYSDDDYSGLYDDRPEFERLIKDGKLGKFNVVLAKTQSRFTRNMEHVEKYLHHDFPLLGIRFIGVVDGVDTRNRENKKTRQISGLVNEWYCEDLSENIKAVFRQKMKAGQYLGPFAPYGYLKDPDDKYKFVIDKYAAGVVRKIYSLYLDGYSIKSICHILEDEGVLNPTLYKKQQGLSYQNVKSDALGARYHFWSETTVKRILSNETYIGRLVQGTCRKVSYKDKKVTSVPRDQWFVTENHHEPVIDSDTFFKVAKLRSRRRIGCENGQGVKKVHPFAGKLRCADCGHTMIKSGGVRGKEGDWYLRCQLSNKSRGKECSSHNIRYSVVEEAVRKRIQETVKQVLETGQYFEKLAALASREDDRKRMPDQKRELRKTESAIESCTKSIRCLYEDRAAQRIDDDLFFRLIRDFEEERKSLSERKNAFLSETEAADEATGRRYDGGKQVREHTAYDSLTYEIVNDFIDRIEIGERDKSLGWQNITIYWQF